MVFCPKSKPGLVAAIGLTPPSWCGGRPPYGFDLEHRGADGTPFEIIRYLDNGERESRDIKGNVIRVLRRGDALGSTKGGSARLVLGSPDKVAVIRRIFEEYASGESGFGAIADRLNLEGIPSPGKDRSPHGGGHLWSSGTVRDLLRNPAYRGAMVWNRISYAKFHRVEAEQAKPIAKTAFGKVKRNDAANWIVVEGVHDAIVSPEVFERAQRMMASRSGRAREALRTASGSSPYLLSGLVTCARCGSKWQGYRTHKGRRRPGQKSIVTVYYACGGYTRKGNAGCKRSLVPQKEFETVVADEASRRIEEYISGGGRETIEAMVKETVEPVAMKEREASLRGRLASTEKRIAELVDCIMPETAAALSTKIAALQRDAKAIKEELQRIREARCDMDELVKLVREIVKDLDGVKHVMEQGTLAERRDVLRALVQQIVYDPDTGEAVVTFFGLPRVGRADPLAAEGKSSSSDLMAGAGFEPATSGL